MALLARRGIQVQHFCSRAILGSCNGALPVTGFGSRHLDSWLMTSEVCRSLLLAGSGRSDLAWIEGPFDAARGSKERPCGGSLDQLADWLKLARIVVLNLESLDNCRLPERPMADALVLDGYADSVEYSRWRTTLESLWGIPVVAALPRLDELRHAARTATPGASAEISSALADALEPTMRLDILWQLASRADLPLEGVPCAARRRLLDDVTVAVAYDDVFHGYYPDALDLLESLGASVLDFSPLHDESLPPETEVVYIGCGHPERYARELGGNHCMMLALAEHVFAGRRVYADGGGLAYLCESLRTAEGGDYPMTGLLPAVAVQSRQAAEPEPVELTLTQSSWLGDSGTKLRGYLNRGWELQPAAPTAPLVAEPGHEHDLWMQHQVIGSRVQFNFAAIPSLAAGLLCPHESLQKC